MDNYKYKIDKIALQDFLVSDSPSQESLRAFKLTFNAVLIKHYQKYMYLYEDLYSQCLVAVLERRERFDPKYSSYNYIYTICRNEICNYINKLKEVYVSDILPLSNASVNIDIGELPSEINKFKSYLTGEVQYTILELTEKEACCLAVFCEMHKKTRSVKVPEFISNCPDAISILYKLLVKI